MKKASFVFDVTPNKGNRDLCLSLTTLFVDLPVRPLQSTSSKKQEGDLLSSGRSFRSTVAQLHKNGLSISGVYKRADGKVVFTTGETLDQLAELLFLRLTANTGWSAVRYNNPDDSVVFASKAPCYLTNTVKGRNALEQPAEVDRDWAKHIITL